MVRTRFDYFSIFFIIFPTTFQYTSSCTIHLRIDCIHSGAFFYLERNILPNKKDTPELPGCRSDSIKPFRIVQIFAVRWRIYKWIISYFAWSISAFSASETYMIVIKSLTTYRAKSPITVTCNKRSTAMQAYPFYIMCHNSLLPQKNQNARRVFYKT